MVYNFSGLVYRLWAVFGIILVLGCLCLLISWYKKPRTNKEGIIVGVLIILYALGSILSYCHYLSSPNVESVTAVFVHEERNSRVAPPLPFTMEYDFSSDQLHTFYLDTFSKKNLFPDEFIEGDMYTVYYEKNTKIIVGIEITP